MWRVFSLISEAVPDLTEREQSAAVCMHARSQGGSLRCFATLAIIENYVEGSHSEASVLI